MARLDLAPVTVRVPASSANLGPGFDALGLALTLHAEAGTGEPPTGGRVVDRHHPAAIAFAAAGGQGELWVRSPIPMSRGLGYSGAMRVGGALAGAAQMARTTVEGRPGDDLAARVLAISAELEGHPDNVAASLFGGVVVATSERVVRVPMAFDPAIVVWIPDTTTSTERSRTSLPPTVSRADAVFNVARSALLVASLANGDVAALREATDDRLHQQQRLAAAPSSAAALSQGLESGAWCGWLSGSGPTIAFMCSSDAAAGLASALPADGRSRVLRIDHDGAVLEGMADDR